MLELLITIALLGLIVWLFTTIVPLPQPFQRVIYVLAVIFLIIILLRAFGLLTYHGDIAVPQGRLIYN